MRFSSLALKIALLVLCFSTLILGAVVANSYFASRELIVRQAEELSRSRGKEVADRLAVILKPIEQSVRNLALAMEDASLTSDKITALSRLVLENNENIFGMAVAFAPYGFSKDLLFFAPYSYRKNGEIRSTYLGNAEYRYFHMDWFKLPEELDRFVWTEPYFDRGGSDAFMTTCSAPFYRMQNGKKVFSGVVTADITLDWLQRLMSTIRIYTSGYAILISRDGTFLYHPDARLQFNESVFSLAEELDDPGLRKIGRSMIEGKTGFLEWKDKDSGRTSFLFYMPLPIGGWSLALFFPRDEVLKNVNLLARNTLLIGGAGLVLFILAITLIVRRVTKPIRKLSTAALAIAGGDMDAPLPLTKSRDEVGILADSFQTMQQSLHRYIADLETTTRQKERIESELRIARDIQMGILPKTFPPFPDHTEFSIFATLEPAREVGGDLYDFFFVDRHHFCFLIGDVSGKGVPAAFLMAVTKTLIKVVAGQGVEPGKILYKVNNDLAEDNDSCMFVTLFIAILDIRNGEIAWASGGHNPPLLLTNGGTTFLKSHNEPIAGVMADMHYTTSRFVMEHGDILFLYTDGVTEAMNSEKEIYSDARLLALLATPADHDPTSLIGIVQDAITDFAGEAEQSDDITMLALQYFGDNEVHTGQKPVQSSKETI